MTRSQLKHYARLEKQLADANIDTDLTVLIRCERRLRKLYTLKLNNKLPAGDINQLIDKLVKKIHRHVPTSCKLVTGTGIGNTTVTLIVKKTSEIIPICIDHYDN